MSRLADISRYFFLPVLTRYFSRNEPIYLVGGCVRDILLGRYPEDFDLVVSGDPHQAARTIAKSLNGSVFRMGNHREAVYRVNTGNVVLDLTSLGGASIEADLLRRDFRINAMAIEPNTLQLIDPFGGEKDLESQTIRMVTETALVQDPVRMLRAFRLAAGLGFSLDSSTTTAIHRHAGRIVDSARERIRAEFFKLLAAADSASHVADMERCGLLTAIFPELSALSGCSQNRHHDFDVWHHTLAAFQLLERMLEDPSGMGIDWPRNAISGISRKRKILLKFCILLHDAGKPETRMEDPSGSIHFYGHETKGSQITRDICLRLMCSRAETEFMETCVRLHLRPLELYLAHQKNTLTAAGITRFFLASGELTPLILIHTLADIAGKTREGTDNLDPELVAFLGSLHSRYQSFFIPQKRLPRLITGEDLMQALGLSPSRKLGKILDEIEEARLAGIIATREEAMEMARHLMELIQEDSEQGDVRNE